MTLPESQSTVYVMMSGGVDSSVAACQLLEQGYDVVGVFIKCWSIEALSAMNVSQELYGCHWEEDARDARLVADRLGIPFYVWDFEHEYKQGVVDYMVREYKHGRTPNPDVMCNSVIKFGIFYDHAMRLGADYVATGHYARRVVGPDGNAHIERGKDTNKDQTYFLWRVDQDRIQKTLFPVGEFDSKAQLRDYAAAHNLITADKKDSQGLCFIGDTPLRDLLIQTLGSQEGHIIGPGGVVLGLHPGAFLYTIGQRNKLGLAGGPWFVSSIDIATNTVHVVHNSQDSELYQTHLEAVDMNWQISDLLVKPDTTMDCTCQIRYRQQEIPCRIRSANSRLYVEFDEPVRAISKGQSIVLYRGKAMLGGAVIDEAQSPNSL